MSPLLRRPQSPVGNTNHVAVGKNSVGVQGQQNLIKPIPQHKEVDGNNVVVPESNGDGGLGSELGEIWPAEMEPVEGNPSPPTLEEKASMGAVDGGEDIITTEERPVEDCLDEQPLEEEHDCERLSPQSEPDEAEPAAPETLVIAPLDGSQAELRTRVIKEVRKPGRNYEAIQSLLQQVKGPLNVQRYFIQHAIKEAIRFKKRVLIQRLESALTELEQKHGMSLPLLNDHGSW